MYRNMKFFAVSAFGLEGIVASELRRLGLPDVTAENGGVLFSGSPEDAYRCNLRLRFSDRVYVLLAEGTCLSFDDLFRLVSDIPWERFAGGTESFLITAQCARSRLMSPRDCQSITKKALIEHLKKKTGQSYFAEKGPEFPVHVSVHSDRVRILLDTSGTSLSRRGYRTWNGEAPLRETLAAALVEMSPWRPGMPLYDPCCGTGTLLIEAALRMGHLAPGLNRHFAMENFCFSDHRAIVRIKAETLSDCDSGRIDGIAGSDISPEALELCHRHIKQAGLSGKISTDVLPLQKVNLNTENGVFLCNPPYGERLGNEDSRREIYHELGLLRLRHPTWSLCAISSAPDFEKSFGRRADKKRRLYNGRLECQFFTFLPDKPGR